MAHYTQIKAKVSLLTPSGTLTAPTTATIATVAGQTATFDLTIGKELLEATELGDAFRQYAQGVGEWSGTLTMHYDADDVTVMQDELLEGIMAASFGGTLVTAGSPGQIQVNFFIDTTASAGKAYYGAMFVGQVNITAGAGLTTMTVELTGNGTPLYGGTLL